MTKVVVIAAAIDSAEDVSSLKDQVLDALDNMSLVKEAETPTEAECECNCDCECDEDLEDEDFEDEDEEEELINVPNQISADELSSKEDIETVKFIDYVNDIAYKIYDKIRDYVNPEVSSHYVTYKVDNDECLLETLKEHFELQGYEFSYEVVSEDEDESTEEGEESEKVAKITLRW